MEKKRIETIELPARRFTVDSARQKVVCGQGHPLALISGPCVIDSRELVFETAKRLVECDGSGACATVGCCARTRR